MTYGVCVCVDGVDCPTVEPVHERYPKDDKKFSKKSNSSGLKYELGISLVTSDLVWMNGPHDAGKSDITIFHEDGLSVGRNYHMNGQTDESH